VTVEARTSTQRAPRRQSFLEDSGGKTMINKTLMFMYRLITSPFVFAFFMLAQIVIGLCTTALYVTGSLNFKNAVNGNIDEN